MIPPAVEAKPFHADRWAELPERGTPVSLRLCGWIAVHLGRSVSRLLLYPITWYFLITGREARLASREYLTRLTGHSPGLMAVFRHLYCFAATILDRVYLLKGEFDCFDVQVHERDVLHRQ